MTDLLARFYMSDCNHDLTPFQSSVKLNFHYDTPFVDATYYHQLVGSFILDTHHDLSLFYSQFGLKGYEKSS